MAKIPELMGTNADTITQYCRQEADTAALAQRFATSIRKGLELNPNSHLNIALQGDLGAGKTTFARFLIQGLGYAGKVKSPTYTLCEPYSLEADTIQYSAHHFDLYRMRDPLEWQEAGFAEYFDLPGFCLIEWPEKAEGTLPPFDIEIELGAGGNESERSIKISALSEQGLALLKSIA
jgi:tRNA threonylcarbamoyladenosine biosynthesis protein TsaE